MCLMQNTAPKPQNTQCLNQSLEAWVILLYMSECFRAPFWLGLGDMKSLHRARGHTHLSDDVRPWNTADGTHAINDDFQCGLRHVLEEKIVLDGQCCRQHRAVVEISIASNTPIELWWVCQGNNSADRHSGSRQSVVT